MWNPEDVMLQCEDLGLEPAKTNDWHLSQESATHLAAAILAEPAPASPKKSWAWYCRYAKEQGCIQDIEPPFGPDKAVALCGFLAARSQMRRLIACKDVIVGQEGGTQNSVMGSADNLFTATLKRILTSVVPHNKAFPSSTKPAKLAAFLAQELKEIPTERLLGNRESLLKATSLSNSDDASLFSEILKAMNEEYALRQQMMLQRLDVTLQSFLWSNRAQGQEAEIISACRPLVAKLHEAQLGVTLDEVLEADSSLADAMYTRVTETRGRTHLKGCVVGTVPDRGGRVEDVRPRDLMPEWAKRTSGGGHRDFHNKQHRQRNKHRDDSSGRRDYNQGSGSRYDKNNRTTPKDKSNKNKNNNRNNRNNRNNNNKHKSSGHSK